MQGSFRIERALADLGRRTDAWQFIRDFAAEWATPIMDGDGSTHAELDDAERRLGSGCQPQFARHTYCSAADAI